MQLLSSAFTHNTSIPRIYTCDGNRLLSPPLSIAGVPEGTVSLVLMVTDPDVPRALISTGVFDHWVLFNIPPNTTEIPEGESVGMAGQNSAGTYVYTGPCPPREYEPSEHRYIFTLYALDTMLMPSSGDTKDTVQGMMQGHVLEQTELIGTYKRVF